MKSKGKKVEGGLFIRMNRITMQALPEHFSIDLDLRTFIPREPEDGECDVPNATDAVNSAIGEARDAVKECRRRIKESEN